MLDCITLPRAGCARASRRRPVNNKTTRTPGLSASLLEPTADDVTQTNMEEKIMENKMEDLKTWVLQRLLKERKFLCHEIELRCEDLIQKRCLEKEKSRMREKDDNLKDMRATEKVGPSPDWMYVLRKEMEKQREEWLKEDSLRRTQETKRWRKEEEKHTEEERRRSDEQTFMAKRLKEMEQRLYDLEKSKERMERERAKEREEMIGFKRMMKADMEIEKERMRQWKEMMLADMEKEKEKMRQYKEMMQRERERENEDMKQYEAMIQRERQTDREEMWEHMDKLKESQRALQKEQALFEEERTKMEEEWRKEKKWMAKCIEEEEAEKLEMKRAMWWMRTERNQEKLQLKVYQQRDIQRMEEMEQLRRDFNETLDAQKEKMEKEFKDRELRMQKWEQQKNDDRQKLWNTATVRLQEEERIRKKTERKTKNLARDMSSQYGNLEKKLFTTVKDFAAALEDMEGCANSRLKDVEVRVKDMQEKLEQDSEMAGDKSVGSTEKKRKKKIMGFFSRWFKK
ncbi:hypothetical protein KOW79_008864 [Hemibagrus wyckioides]|uniref:Uncharacterized protein n=1 Tax=Hemibagrus wyckioides TaxID=337641 RepID=A0A9D3SPW6_9TELE|nr:hypothetical protein KOW79_008864 [Hemibagrus wyckioides]